MEDFEFKESLLLLSDVRGIYIPKDFAHEIDHERIVNLTEELTDCLEVCKDHEHENYWDCWQVILDNMQIKIKDKVYNLYQDGDLLAVIYE